MILLFQNTQPAGFQPIRTTVQLASTPQELHRGVAKLTAKTQPQLLFSSEACPTFRFNPNPIHLGLKFNALSYHRSRPWPPDSHLCIKDF